MLTINPESFIRAHNAFIHYVSERDRFPFTEFDRSRFLHKTELDYKKLAFQRGHEALNLDQWPDWCEKPGKILAAVRKACDPAISKNLLEHRYGPQGGSYKALYLVESTEEIQKLESELYNFYLGGAASYEQFSQRFERFIAYLRKNSLGASWQFVTYLAFLLDCELYFEVLPTRFEKTLNYLGTKQKIQGSASWALYKLFLDLAMQLKELLVLHSPEHLIDIHTYIFLLGDAIIPRLEKGEFVEITQPDELALLEKRLRAVKNREKIGLLGELAVIEYERMRLRSAGRVDLANRVEHVADNRGSRCDIISFTEKGQPISIEVKATIRNVETGDNFFLTKDEKAYAEECGESWCLYRVVFPGTTEKPPEITTLGNVVTDSTWELSPASWLLCKKTGPENEE